MPWKTFLTIATFAGLMQAIPALRNLETFNPKNIALIWQMAPPAAPPAPLPPLKPVAIRQHPGDAPDPKSVVDPTHQMDHFYASLAKGGVTRVVHYGDSPTTADLITADARALLQEQFGDAGSGFVLIARPWAWYGHRGVEMSSSNWKIDVAGVPGNELKDGLHGLGAASFRGSTGSVAHWTLKDAGHSSVEISYLTQPDGGSFSMDADGVEIGSADTAGEQGPGFASFTFPPTAKNFTLRVTSGRVRLYGADFRKAGHGVVYSSAGINGANITLLTHAINGPHWAAELQHYQPDLVVIAFGTNESGYPKFIDGGWAGEMQDAVRRVRAAVPEASILLMSPMDRGERKDNGEIGTVEAMPRLVALESKVAAASGAAFFNTFEAMGGEGTMGKWYNGEPRLVGADFIHPMPMGARIVGELLYNALREGYNGYKLRQLREQAGLRDPAVESAGTPPPENVVPGSETTKR
jgi:lysophospholipase L1-like esterase